ncbi:MAG TPA: translation initiation factor Sui1 [Geobacteraceae bacterium]|nr:translation initiation factor Sui1 [Geobacteraceae bacterium]
MKSHESDDAPLVYSTEFGRMCPACGKPAGNCICGKKRLTPTSDGIVRIRRETKGRGGKKVTIITGLPMEEPEIKKLAGELKRRCGTGGTVKNGVIEMQGDCCGVLLTELESRGFRVKRAGG